MVVEIPISAASLADTMGRMRGWLDEHQCTPVLFATKSKQAGSVLIHVEFADAADAAAFQAAFRAAKPKAPAAAASVLPARAGLTWRATGRAERGYLNRRDW